MREVVSISLGTSKRDKEAEVELMGETYLVKRVGTDGDVAKFKALFSELDGKVAAFGVGGADISVRQGEKEYRFREITQWIAGAKRSPVVDGAGLKHTLERNAISWLQSHQVVDFQKERVLLMSGVDRFGMAQALDKICPDVMYGDLMYGLGVPIPVRKYSTVRSLGKILLPVITQLPFKWFYPTGEKQEKRDPKFLNTIADRTLYAGDSLFILKYAPDQLEGKTILTQSVRKANIEWFKEAGLKRLITTTPVIEGETFATNVVEALLVAHLKKTQDRVTPADYEKCLTELGWKPEVIEFSKTEVHSNS